MWDNGRLVVSRIRPRDTVNQISHLFFFSFIRLAQNVQQKNAHCVFSNFLCGATNNCKAEDVSVNFTQDKQKQKIITFEKLQSEISDWMDCPCWNLFIPSFLFFANPDNRLSTCRLRFLQLPWNLNSCCVPGASGAPAVRRNWRERKWRRSNRSISLQKQEATAASAVR